MKQEIDARRRVRISLFSGQGSPAGTYLFDAQGNFLEVKAGRPLAEKEIILLAGEVRKMPRISGREKRELLWEGERISLSILRYIHMTLGELPDIQAACIPDREAVADCGQNRRLTYRQLKEESDALAVSLIRLGIEKGDKAAVIMDNCWQNIVTKAAIEKIGAVIVNLNIHEKGEMLTALLRDADVKAVLIRQGIKAREHMEILYAMCPELRDQEPGKVRCGKLPALRTIVVTDPERPEKCAWQFGRLLEEGRRGDRDALEKRKRAVDPLDPVTIIHTSGSSGKPKGALLTNAQLVESALSHVAYMRLTQADRFYMTSPMFHALGCIGSALASMTAGSALVFHGTARCDSLLPILKAEQCTVLSSVPTVYLRILELAGGDGSWKGQIPLRLCITAGAPCPVKVFEGLRKAFGVEEVLTMYGMTEAGPGISSTSITSLDQAEHPGGSELWPGVNVQIRALGGPERAADSSESGSERVKAERRVLEPGEIGEICVESFGVMQCYYKNPQETAKALDRNGWLRTGDMGYLSPEGKLFLTGRYKDLIIRGGENISPGEVEEFLRKNPQVEDAAVVGVPDAQYGELVFAFIKPAAGEAIDSKALAAWCRGKIATIKIPQFMAETEAFPETGSGKVDKKELKKLASVLCKKPECRV